MELYRLTKQRYGEDLSGTGAFLAGGRWNNRGRYVLYTASSRSLALVEALAHLVTVRNTESYQMLVLYLPDDASVQVYTDKTLPEGWQHTPVYTQQLGDAWTKKQETLLLRVPSAIVPKEYNVLINPQHGDFRHLRIMDTESFSFDTRLKN